MRQKRLVSGLIIFFCVLPLVSRSASAANYAEVLGVTTQTTPQIPPTHDGPGLILPDSPLFFLDKLKQNARLLFAIAPQEKAVVYNSIAGERLAELRIMLARGNKQGISIDLSGVSDNLSKAADAIVASKTLYGNNTTEEAKTINLSIKEKMASLDILHSQANGELAAETAATQTSLLASKAKVENILPDDVLQNEIKDDVSRLVTLHVNDAAKLVKDLETEVNFLNAEASAAAQEARTKREKLLQTTLAQKNSQLKSVQDKVLFDALDRQDKLFQAEATALTQAKQAVAAAQVAATQAQAAQKAVSDLQQSSANLPNR